MKIVKNILHLAKIILPVCCFAACDYLDVVPPETADFGDTMRDKDDAIGFLYSCYASIGYSAACNNLGAIESSTDEYVNPLLWARMGQQVSWNQLSPTYNSNWSPVSLPWNPCYNDLGQCHLFLKTLDELNPKGVTMADRERWKAEILFLQAYYHFRLLQAYGPIPIVDHYYSQTTSKSELPGRSHFDYCVDKIVDWLDAAAKVLPATMDTENLGRATSTICKALKSRVLLYAASPLWNGSFPYPQWQNTNYETPGYGKELVSTSYSREKWVRAKTACQEALDWALSEGNRSLFDLKTSESLRAMQQLNLPDIPGTDEEFKKKVMQMRYMMCTAETEGSKEVIWGIATARLSTNTLEAVPHWVVTKNDGSAWGGVCAMSPLLYTAEHFYTVNGKLPVNDSQLPEDSWFESAGYSGRENIIRLNTKREPRFYAWLSFDGDEFGQKLTDGSPLIVQMRNSLKQGYNPGKFNRDNCVTGYSLKKWAAPNLTFRKDGGHNNRPVPAPFIRLAELYLNLAECHAALGEQQPALDNLNEVRERAGITDVETKDLNEMPLMDWIRNERFVELYAEGHRYYDARRWMIAPQLFKAGTREGLNAIEKENPTFDEFNRRVKIDQPFQWDDRMYLIPVSASEIYNNPQLIQAPKY